MSQKYADIIIDISHEAIDRTFQYMVPAELENSIEVGCQVQVPFGAGTKERKGYVINITETPGFDLDRMKEISGICDKGLKIEGRLIKLAAWIRKNYGSTMIDALKTVMPVKEQVRKTKERVRRQELTLTKAPVTALNRSQEELVSEFIKDREQNINKTYLLHGVTGSGKTEVYIACIKHIVKEGRQAIVLIPEIGLTYQNVARFRQHFGERVAVINSKQSKGEKYEEFMRAKRHEVDVIIGPRSALFTPCNNLGLIVIDEEHDGAYKSDQTPKYHAREVAIERSMLENASVILGSATPTIESYEKAKLGRYRLWELPYRPYGMELSDVSVVDMREELKKGNRSIISKSLYELIDLRLSKGEQVMLFINRRGFNTFVSCRECGEVIKCPKCDVALSLHNNGLLMCHYCGHTEREAKICPVCKSRLIGGFGTGTQKVEEEIHRLFPQAKVLRMDKDTTSKKGSTGEILNDFLMGKGDILIGTQMIVKGHDFENVTLVGVILADLSLFDNDYRSGEKTFDLLTQAAGRAGRGKKKGHVLIQTYQPGHYAIRAAAKQDYEGFFETEMTYRKLLKYPPVYNMMVVLLVGLVYDEVVKASDELSEIIRNTRSEDKTLRVIGPSDATISRIKDLYRRVIYIKGKEEESLYNIRRLIDAYERDGIKVVVDVNPVNMY